MIWGTFVLRTRTAPTHFARRTDILASPWWQSSALPQLPRATARYAAQAMAYKNTLGRGFRRSALDVHYSYAALRPLVAGASQLAVNARIAAVRLGEEGRPFAEVAKEIELLAMTLDSLIYEAGHVYRVLTRSVADWSRALRMRELLVRGLKYRGSDEIQELLQQRVDAKEEVVTSSLECIAQTVTHLSQTLSQLHTVAARQSHFIGLTAATEAARVRGGVLRSVAGEIRNLAEDLEARGQEAGSGVVDLEASLGTLGIGGWQ